MLLDMFGALFVRHGGDSADFTDDKRQFSDRRKRDEALTATIEATYQRLMGITPPAAVVAKVKTETPKELRDYTQELKFTEWLSAQIAAELDDEEALLLLI